MSDSFQEIQAVLGDYFDALYFCDVDRLRRVFHAQSIYATADETPFLFRNLEAYAGVIATRQSPASRQEQRRDHIDAIDLAGDNTAVARVRCSIGTRDFVDILTLVRTDGTWRIIARVFQIIDRNP